MMASRIREGGLCGGGSPSQRQSPDQVDVNLTHTIRL